MAEFLPLSGDTAASVCVIGAGETGRTTAHFFPPDEWYVDVEHSFGPDKARLVADSFSKAIDLLESIVQNEGIACEFERLDGYLYAIKIKRNSTH